MSGGDPIATTVANRRSEPDRPVPEPRSQASAFDGALVVQTPSGWTLHAQAQRGRSASSTLPIQAEPADVAGRLVEAFEQAQSKSRRCVLALDSGEVFFNVFQAPDAIDRRDRAAIQFELERFIPLDAESMVSDHWTVQPNGRIAAIAIGVDRHRAIVDAFEEAQIDLVSIVPRSFLIAKAVQDQRTDRDPFRLFLLGDEGTESMTVHPEGVAQWKHYSGLDEKFLLRESIGLDHEQSDLIIIAVGPRDDGLASAGPVSWCDQSAQTLLEHGAALSIQGKMRRWPDLRRDQLAPEDPLYAVAQPLRWLALAATVCLLAISIAASYRGDRISLAAEQIDQQKRVAFRKAFPGRRVPVLMMRSMRSDYSKAMGSRGRGDDLKLPVPATRVLADVIGGLKDAKEEGARFRLIDLNVEDGTVSITVRARESVQIGQLARSLESAGFDVDPPASEQIESTRDEPASYQSTLTAIWVPAADRKSTTRPASEDRP